MTEEVKDEVQQEEVKVEEQQSEKEEPSRSLTFWKQT